jgi:DNA repair protein RecO (recombination protein O)
VLRRQDLAEADRLITLYTVDRGKVRAIAKGVRKPASRKAGHLELFSRTELLLARGRELDIIAQAESIDTFSSISTDLSMLSQAAYAAELLDRFTIEGQEGQDLYRLMVQTLERLDQGDDPSTVLRNFELRLLELSGFRPEVFQCVLCSQEIRPEDQFFSSKDGGVVCPSCGKSHTGLRSLSLGALKVLRHYQRNDYDEAKHANISSGIHSELEGVMEDYFSYLAERGLNAPRFVRDVRNLAISSQ